MKKTGCVAGTIQACSCGKLYLDLHSLHSSHMPH